MDGHCRIPVAVVATDPSSVPVTCFAAKTFCVGEYLRSLNSALFPLVEAAILNLLRGRTFDALASAGKGKVPEGELQRAIAKKPADTRVVHNPTPTQFAVMTNIVQP